MKKKQQEMREHILKANKKYRKGKPIMSDSEFDSLLEKYVEKYPDDKKLQKVMGYKISRKEDLEYPMMSMDKLKTCEQVIGWLDANGVEDSEYLVFTGKFDGISLLVKEYEKRCHTRGDGTVGQASHKHFEMMGEDVQITDLLTFGEAIISRENWEEQFSGKINPKNKKEYKVPRNTVAGLFNSSTPDKMLKYVDYVRYGIADSKASHSLTLEKLVEISSKSAPYEMVSVGAFRGYDNPEEFLNELYEKFGKDYQIDGLIVDINSSQAREKLGREENGNPAYARAIKLSHWSEQDNSDTMIRGKNIKISKQGKLKGYVKFDPLDIDGTEVKQASFYNAKFLTQFVLTEGIKIKVKKSGEIIPKIIEVEGVRIPMREDCKKIKDFEKALEEAQGKVQEIVGIDKFSMLCDDLVACPCCGSVTRWDEKMVELECTNKKCPSRLLMKATNFFLKLGIEDFGETEISNLFGEGYDTIEKIFTIKKSDLTNINGWGKKSAKRLLTQIAAVKDKSVPLARVLDAMDLFDGKIGEKTVQLIIDSVHVNWNATIDELCKIKGVSEITAKIYQKGIKRFVKVHGKWRKKNGDTDYYLNIVPEYYETPVKELTSKKMSGMHVCFTGVRDNDVEEYIKSNGGTIANGVSRMTTHLVVADLSTKSLSTSKAVKALANGIPVITLECFKEEFLH